METDPIGDAEALIASGRAAEAVRELRARLAAGRGGLLARLTLVKALLESGARQGALEEAREAVALNPAAAMAVMALGEVLLRLGALPAAIAELQRALRLDPALEQARFLIGCAWLDAGEAEKALEIFEAWRRRRISKPGSFARAPCCGRRVPTPDMSGISSINSPPITTRA